MRSDGAWDTGDEMPTLIWMSCPYQRLYYTLLHPIPAEPNVVNAFAVEMRAMCVRASLLLTGHEIDPCVAAKCDRKNTQKKHKSGEHAV